MRAGLLTVDAILDGRLAGGQFLLKDELAEVPADCTASLARLPAAPSRLPIQH